MLRDPTRPTDEIDGTPVETVRSSDRADAPEADVPVATIRIVLADAHRVVRAGLGLLLAAEPEMHVVGESGDVDGALTEVVRHKPEVLVLEPLIEGSRSALAALHFVRDRCPDTAIVVLTAQGDARSAQQALRAGVIGYVLKDAEDADLVRAIRRAARGLTSLDPTLAARIALLRKPPTGPPDDLSAREFEVLRLIALGHTNAAIGAQLVLSIRTVETHRAHLQQKLGRSTRAELVRYALDQGLLRDGESAGRLRAERR